jgi:hypothetical protein
MYNKYKMKLDKACLLGAYLPEFKANGESVY